MNFKSNGNIIDSKEMLSEYIDKILSKDGYSTDDFIKIKSKCKYINDDLVLYFNVYGEENKKQPEFCMPLCKRNKYKKQIINTIEYINNNFEKIYKNMLKFILSFPLEIENFTTGEIIEDIDTLNKAKESINYLNLNCQKELNGFLYYSLIFRIDCSKYGFDDGFEIIFYKDKPVFLTDGNSGQALVDYADNF